MTLHLQGGFGAVHKAIRHGIIVAAKIIQLQKGVTVKEAYIMRHSLYLSYVVSYNRVHHMQGCKQVAKAMSVTPAGGLLTKTVLCYHHQL